MNRFAPLVAALALIAGCTTNTPAPTQTIYTGGSLETSTVPTDNPTSQGTFDPSPTSDLETSDPIIEGKFEEVFPAGAVDILVTAPRFFKPEGTFLPEKTPPAEWTKYLAVDITMTNPTAEPIDIFFTKYTLYVGKEAGIEIVGDTDHDYGFTGDTNLLPGKAKTWTAAFAVPDTGKIELEFIAPPDRYPVIIFK